jgi:hypothetical protein
VKKLPLVLEVVERVDEAWIAELAHRHLGREYLALLIAVVKRPLAEP